MSKTTKNNSTTKTTSIKPTATIKALKKPTPSISKIVPPLRTTSIETKFVKQSTKEDGKSLIPKVPKINTQINNSKIVSNRLEAPKIKTIPSKSSLKLTIPNKSQPIRAKHTPEIVKNVQNIKKIPISKTNLVTNTFQNVTVLSPPPIRRSNVREKPVENIKEAIERAGGIKQTKEQSKSTPRERTRTKTLDPDEIIILKNDPNGPTSIDSLLDDKLEQKNNVISIGNTKNVKFKESVSFEIDFSEQKSKEIKNSMLIKSQDADESPDYEDDFESYESDFETEESTSENVELQSSKEITDSDEDEDECVQDDDDDDDDDDEDSDETHPPITVIQVTEKESEKKLDSGNYDLSSRNQQHQQQQQPQPDSLDTSNAANSEQLDSGLGYLNGNAVQNIQNENSQRKFSKRGILLMKKIQLDTITNNLFEIKPINYEYFMKIYGNLNTNQANTQTNENHLNSDTQTDNFMENNKSMWTQHPPQYDLKFFQDNHIINIKQNNNSCGEFDQNNDNDNQIDNDELLSTNDPLKNSIKLLNRFRQNKLNQLNNNYNKNNNKKQQINYDHLNEFLNKSSLTIANILNNYNNFKQNKLNVSLEIGFSNGYKNLNANFLNALRVIKIFSNIKFNIILTIHESIDDIYRNDFINLISVWNTNELDKPIRLLSSWSYISRADICTESSDIIVCGLRDGSISMWDLRETNSYCSKLDGSLTHFAATHSISPHFGGDEMKYCDLGAIVDIKSFKTEARAYNLKAYKQLQFVSLNDTGILTIWTLVQTGKNDFNLMNLTNKNNPNNKMEYSSPWARVKLIQSAICDLREYLELKNIKIESKFHKTRSYFENDIFNDETLRELNDTKRNSKLGLQGLRFISLDTSSNLIYIATNRNFIISCSKTLKTERFRKIFIDDSKFLFPTALRLHTNAEFLFVGLSNGSVMALNCNQNRPKDYNQDNETNSMNDLNDNDDDDDELELVIGKSCTIQNIIRNERKSSSHNGNQNTNLYDIRPRTAISEFYDENELNSNYRIFDQQIILNGSVLRKNLIENIEISNDGKKLYALADGNIRSYDFCNEIELNRTKELRIKGICLIKENADQQSLIIMTNNDVQVHSIK